MATTERRWLKAKVDPTRDRLRDELGALIAADDRRQAREDFEHRLAGGCHLDEMRASPAIAGLRWIELLTDGGITPAESFGRRIRAKLGALLLPTLVPEGDVRSWLDPLFKDPKAIALLETLSPRTIARVLERLGARLDDVVDEMRTAERTLALRIGAAGTSAVIAQRSADLGLDATPFVELAERTLSSGRDVSDVESLTNNIAACRETTQRLRDHHRAGGSSFQLTVETRRVLEQLDRLEALVAVSADADDSARRQRIAALLRDLVVEHYSHVTLGQVVADTSDLVAYQVTEQAASRSKKYVGEQPGDYWRLLRAGLLGGAVVAIFACLKLLIAKISLPLGVQALVHGINYSVCFLLIYAIGATLATKQPAFTAAAIASLLDRAQNRADGLHRVARRIAAVWRNQFVSLIGNVLCALPFAAAISLAYASLGGDPLASPEKATYLIDTNAPWRSLALYYAAIAGVFLFAAGLIQGAVDNRVAYAKVRERIRQHPRLAFLGKRREWLADRLSPHLGAIAGNVSLGFLLGSAGTIGAIFGLPIDIRHVAFSSAHIGVAFSSDLGLAVSAMAVIAAGVLLIGLVNFIFSFGLTLWVSLKSRRVSFTQWRVLLATLASQFARRPLDWFWPPRTSATARLDQPSSTTSP